MVAFRSWLLLASLLAAAFVGKSDGAIRCYQCTNCSMARDLTECTEVTYVDNIVSLIIKKTDQEATLKRAGLTVGKIKKQSLDHMVSTDSVFSKEVEAALTGSPTSCYRMGITKNEKELIYRGCGHDLKPGCGKMKGIEVCACKENGCNSAPIDSNYGLLFTTCLFIFISLLNV